MKSSVLSFAISVALLTAGGHAQTPEDKRVTVSVPQTPLGQLTQHEDVPGASQSIAFDRGTVSIDLVADPRGGDQRMDLLVEGHDNLETPWQVRTEYVGGLGFAEAWQADLDANGALDLILVNSFPLNGWCIDRKRLMIVMLDEEGNPVPWEMESVFDAGFQGGRGVVELLDLNDNGRAEFVQVNCDQGNYAATAVYEASGARWHRLSGDEAMQMLGEYQEIAGKRRNLSVASDRDRFIPDYSNAADGELWRAIDSFVPAEQRPLVTLPPVRDGRMIQGKELEDWQRNEDEATSNRWFLSDGTKCYGVPSMIVDRPEGRLAVTKSGDAALELFQEIIREKWPVTLFGNLESRRCSPAWIWVKGK